MLCVLYGLDDFTKRHKKKKQDRPLACSFAPALAQLFKSMIVMKNDVVFLGQGQGQGHGQGNEVTQEIYL